MPATFEQQIADARKQLAAGDPQGAFEGLDALFGSGELANDTAQFVATLHLFATIAQQIAGATFAAQIERAAKAPDDVATLNALGYECVESRLYHPAICVLERALQRAPHESGVLGELVTALQCDGQHARACDHLRASKALLGAEFGLRYQLAFNALMSGEVDAAVADLEALGEPPSEDDATLTQALAAMLERAGVARTQRPLGPHDLRGWHFVTTGGILLHLSPFGFDEGMNGRYAMVQDSAHRCRLGLLRLHAVLDEWDQLPERILLLPDRHSEALGRAAAAMFGVEALPYDPAATGLVIAYDLDAEDLELPPSLLSHTPGQLLFAHAACWTSPPACAADLTTYLYQTNAPLGQHLEGTRGEDEDPTTEVLVQRILDAIVHNPDELATDGLEALVGFAATVAAHTAAARPSGPRPPLHTGGPVKSSRFG